MNYNKTIKQLEESMKRLADLDVTNPESKVEINRANSLQSTAKAIVAIVRTEMEAKSKELASKQLKELLEKEDENV